MLWTIRHCHKRLNKCRTMDVAGESARWHSQDQEEYIFKLRDSCSMSLAVWRRPHRYRMMHQVSGQAFSIAWLEAMRLRGLSSHGTLGLAVQILSSSFCSCNRQFCSLVPPMPVRCGLQPQLALVLSGILSSFRGPSSAELAVSTKVFLWTSYFRSRNRCVGMTSGGGGSLVYGRLWLRLLQALYTASSSMMRFSWSLQGASLARLPRSSSAFQLWVSPCLW